MSFSERLKTLRAEHHMTQKMLAERMNVARTTITGYETKDRQPSHEKLTAMADIFGVTVDYLIDSKDGDAVSDTLCAQQENLIDQQVMRLYHQLTPKSKEEALKYLRLLELWEKNSQA